MNKYLAVLAAQLILASGLARVAAQQAKQPVFRANSTAERIPNLDTLKKELREYHDCRCPCGCYAHDLNVQADRAMEFLSRLAARRQPRQKLAVIFDIDETALSNYQEMRDADFGYNPRTFDAWVQQAKAPAIPGTLRVYKEAQRLGMSIFVISGRPEQERAATERNLRAQGFEHWQQLILRSDTSGSETIGQFKAKARSQIVARGYTLALNVGDQWSDLKGKPEAEFSVKYPDPFYFIP